MKSRFNSKMVRLKVTWFPDWRVKTFCFNSKMVRLKAVKRRTKINYFSIAWQIKNNYFNRKNLTMCNHIKTPRLRQLYINFWFSVCQRTCFVIWERIADYKIVFCSVRQKFIKTCLSNFALFQQFPCRATSLADFWTKLNYPPLIS